jgi:hypothetical protein
MDYNGGIKKPPHFEECGGQDLHRKKFFESKRDGHLLSQCIS